MLPHRLNDLNQGIRSQTCAPDEQAKGDYICGKALTQLVTIIEEALTFFVDFLILDNVRPGTQRRSHDAYFPDSVEMMLCLDVNSIPPEHCPRIAAYYQSPEVEVITPSNDGRASRAILRM
ncbi:hypothetical protein M404DRAFT_20622 [Pisolithus tinctorius Marx 270]|uniref:Uncharacterized protein n=1 Tax=Pisolithus tinctorius Marx 270 TaxID=870435 RepID=A0A0C3PR95_PISTI|nr:hypothetical protein M404DRAFT_20622 [Pisolithus tinctorius Marx 270]